jgi:hypothetical protein
MSLGVQAFSHPRIGGLPGVETDDPNLFAVLAEIRLDRDNPGIARKIGSSFSTNLASAFSFPSFTTISPKTVMTMGSRPSPMMV